MRGRERLQSMLEIRHCGHDERSRDSKRSEATVSGDGTHERVRNTSGRCGARKGTVDSTM